MQMRGAEPGRRRGGGDAFQDGGSSSHFPAKSGLQADTRALDRDSCMPPMPSTRACSGTQVSGALRQRHGGFECRCRVRGGSVHLASSSSVAWFLGDQDTPCTPTLGSTKRSAESQEGRPLSKQPSRPGVQPRLWKLTRPDARCAGPSAPGSTTEWRGSRAFTLALPQCWGSVFFLGLSIQSSVSSEVRSKSITSKSAFCLQTRAELKVRSRADFHF